MNEEKLYPKYRYIMGALQVLASSITVLPYMVAAPLLTYLAADFSVDVATAGYATTAHILTMGIFIFLGSVVISWIDNKKTQIAGLVIIVAGLAMAWRASSFGMLLAARVITGIGHGISGACTTSVVAAWFPPRERSVVITINNLVIMGITALGYFIMPPLYHLFGDSWRAVMLFVAGAVALTALLWILWGRDNRALNEHLAAQNSSDGRKTNAFSGMREALSRRDIWTLAVHVGLTTMAVTGMNTYLPQFLENVRGYTDVAASALTGVITAVGVAGTLSGGVVTTALGRRKPFIAPFVLATAIFGALGLGARTPWLITSMLILYSLANNFRTTAYQTMATEFDGTTPALAAAASAMYNGLGFIGTLALPALFSLGEGLMGDVGSMLIFMPLFAIAAVISCFLPETGPKKKG